VCVCSLMIHMRSC